MRKLRFKIAKRLAAEAVFTRKEVDLLGKLVDPIMDKYLNRPIAAPEDKKRFRFVLKLADIRVKAMQFMEE